MISTSHNRLTSDHVPSGLGPKAPPGLPPLPGLPGSPSRIGARSWWSSTLALVLARIGSRGGVGRAGAPGGWSSVTGSEESLTHKATYMGKNGLYYMAWFWVAMMAYITWRGFGWCGFGRA